MFRSKITQTLITSVLVILISACTPAATPTPEPTSPPPPTSTEKPTEAPTPTPIPDTPTPAGPTATPTPVLVMSIEGIVGDWFAKGADAMYHRFNSDGSCLVATTKERLDTQPSVECTCTFEDTQMTMECQEAVGLPPCPGDGIYEVELLSNGNIYFRRVRDSCGARVNTMRQEYYLVP